MFKRFFYKHPYLVLFSLGLLVRYFSKVLFFSNVPVKFFEYEVIALNLINGKGYVYPHFFGETYALISPLFTYICFLIYKIFGHQPLYVLIFQSLCSSLLGVLLYRYIFILTDEIIASFVGGILIIFHPALIYYDINNLHYLSFATLLIFCLGGAFVYFYQKPSFIGSIYFGLMGGVNALERSITIPFFILVSGGLFLKNKYRLFSLVSVAVFFICTSPWIIRNYAKFNRLVLTTNAGEVFWRSNNSQATGTSHNQEGATLSDVFYKEHQAELLGKNEVEINNFYFKKGVEWIINHPISFITLYTKKIFSFVAIPIVPLFGEYSNIQKKMIIFYYICLFLALMMASIYFFKNKYLFQNAPYCFLFLYGSCILVQSFFYFEGRHRVMTDPFIFLFISYVLGKKIKFS